MTTIEEISETLAQTVYGKSSKLDAPENQNDDFCWGYSMGMMATEEDDITLMLSAWRNYGSPTGGPPDWLDWKRGFHAGRFAAIGAAAPAHPQHNACMSHGGHK